jgi:hypothetical protein
MQMQRIIRSLTYFFAALILFGLAACGTVATVTVQPSATSATTPVASSTPGGSGGGTAQSCSDILQGAVPATAGANFTDLPLPGNSISTAVTKTSGGGDGQFTIYQFDLCTSGTSPQAIFTFFANTLPAQNWPHQIWFPFDGYFYSSCGDDFCWASGGTAPPRYVGLENVQSKGNGLVTYHLRLATPPPAPNCGSSPSFQPGYYYNLQNLAAFHSTNVYSLIPLPPLTRYFPNDATGHIGFGFCSAPSAATITSFMTHHLTQLGWHQTSPGVWANGTHTLNLSITSNVGWSISFLNPDI